MRWEEVNNCSWCNKNSAKLGKIQGNVPSWKSDALLTEMLNRSNSLPGTLEPSNPATSKPLKSNRKHMTHWQESYVSHISFLLLVMLSYLFKIFVNQNTPVQTAFGSWGRNCFSIHWYDFCAYLIMTDGI